MTEIIDIWIKVRHLLRLIHFQIRSHSKGKFDLGRFDNSGRGGYYQTHTTGLLGLRQIQLNKTHQKRKREKKSVYLCESFCILPGDWLMYGSMSLKVLGIVSMKFVILTAPRVAMQSSRKRRLLIWFMYY